MMGSVEGFQERLICDAEMGVAIKFVGVEGGVMSGVGRMGLLTVMVTGFEVVVLPAWSRAVAVRVWVPFETPVVFHCPSYMVVPGFGVVSSVPRFAPSSLNWTPAIPLVV